MSTSDEKSPEKTTPTYREWTCGCGKVFDVFDAYYRHGSRCDQRTPHLSESMNSFLYARSDKLHVDEGKALPPRRGPRRGI